MSINVLDYLNVKKLDMLQNSGKPEGKQVLPSTIH